MLMPLQAAAVCCSARREVVINSLHAAQRPQRLRLPGHPRRPSGGSKRKAKAEPAEADRDVAQAAQEADLLPTPAGKVRLPLLSPHYRFPEHGGHAADWCPCNATMHAYFSL